MDPVARIALAIWREDLCGSSRCPRKAWAWELLDRERVETYWRMAQAAIRAMSEAS